MKIGFIRIIGFLVLVSLIAFLALGRSAQTTRSTPNSLYEYKVEMVKVKQDLDQRLRQNSPNGWRVQSVVALPSDNELVVILERPVSH